MTFTKFSWVLLGQNGVGGGRNSQAGPSSPFCPPLPGSQQQPSVFGLFIKSPGNSAMWPNSSQGTPGQERAREALLFQHPCLAPFVSSWKSPKLPLLYWSVYEWGCKSKRSSWLSLTCYSSLPENRSLSRGHMCCGAQSENQGQAVAILCVRELGFRKQAAHGRVGPCTRVSKVQSQLSRFRTSCCPI